MLGLDKTHPTRHLYILALCFSSVFSLFQEESPCKTLTLLTPTTVKPFFLHTRISDTVPRMYTYRVLFYHRSPFPHLYLSWSQSYDRELGRQCCSTQQIAECVFKIKIFSTTFQNTLFYFNTGVVAVHKCCSLMIVS
jgi:hypothetical protein